MVCAEFAQTGNCPYQTNCRFQHPTPGVFVPNLPPGAFALHPSYTSPHLATGIGTGPASGRHYDTFPASVWGYDSTPTVAPLATTNLPHGTLTLAPTAPSLAVAPANPVTPAAAYVQETRECPFLSWEHQECSGTDCILTREASTVSTCTCSGHCTCPAVRVFLSSSPILPFPRLLIN